jgi:CheY-like chemotaxis protein
MTAYIRPDSEALFLEQVRDALDHFYDRAALNQHPLLAVLGLSANPTSATPPLQQCLLNAIDALKPASAVPKFTLAWRDYHILQLRYIEALSSAEVAEQLGVGERQLRRDHNHAVLALADVLRTLADSPPAHGALDRDIEQLGAAPASGLDSAQLVGAVAALISGLAARRGSALAISCPAGLPTVYANMAALRQILIGLLACAVEHGPQARLQVARAGDMVELQVEVAGGRPPAEDDARLSVCRQLMALQHISGAITRRADGLRAVLRLPTRLPTVVLVVDDNPDLVRLFQRFLAAIGGRVVSTNSGEEALRLAREHRPHLMLLDVMMPLQDGWEVLQQFKNHPEIGSLPIVVCSVLKEHDLALSLGADAFLPKPVSQGALLEAVARWSRP